jgi:hypothetical protein
MWRTTTMALGLGAALLVNVAPAYAQRWGREATPRSGVCFYEDINFGGRYFCTSSGSSTPQLSSADNDRISSIRVFGDARVTVFQNPNFRGPSRAIDSSVSDLRSFGFNDRISSYQVDANGYNGGYGQNGTYGNNGVYRGNRQPNVPYGTSGRANGSRWEYRDAQRTVQQSYRAVLGRDPDADGLRYWTDQVMNNNWSQRDLENALRQSDEYRQQNRARRR